MADFYALYVGSGGGGSGGTGDVVGPVSADNNGLVLFDGTTGKLIKEATGTGIVKITSGVASVLADPLPIANGGTNSSAALNNNRVIVSSGSAIVEASAITASRALVSDVSGIPVAATTTATEIGYVNGVTSSIQTQLNSKQATLTIGNLTAAGTDGIAVTGGPGSVIGAGTSIAQQVADATHNGYLSSTDWSTFNSKQASGSYITALSGDVTASGPGSAAATLATVNSNVGSFGASTAIPSVTVNAKGLVTAASTNAVIAPAGTLTGTTLASNVVSSSLTSVGTITSGTWTGTTIALANGGTGQTTKAAAFDALSPMTTKGDMIAYSTTGVRVAVGTDGQAMIADAASTPGVKWGTPTPMLASSMSDTVATSLGYKTYLHGTTYNGGNAPTVTTNRASTSVKRAAFIPYQTQDGSWRLKIDLVVEYTANTSVIVTIAGITFKNDTNYYQALAYTGFAGGAEQAYCNPGGSTMSADATISTGRAALNGDIELDSKPNWAY